MQKLSSKLVCRTHSHTEIWHLHTFGTYTACVHAFTHVCMSSHVCGYMDMDTLVC